MNDSDKNRHIAAIIQPAEKNIFAYLIMPGANKGLLIGLELIKGVVAI